MAFTTLPKKVSASRFLSLGSTGLVYQITSHIALKYACTSGSTTFENEMFDLFEKHTPCPHVIQSFLRLPNANFLALMSGGSLDARLRSYQIRKDPFGKVLEVSKTEPITLVKQWLMELCRAVVWLESLGYVHGDLRPSNLLLDDDDHLKLGDFDCVQKVGEHFEGNRPPWARILGDDAEKLGLQRGSFGITGPRTEQFAIGSNLYCMVYGFEPYEDTDDQGPIIVDWFQEMKFPELNKSCLDFIIDRCWKGYYQELRDLLLEIESLCDIRVEAKVVSMEELDQRRKECQILVEDGLLN
ncbi:kinase domain-containing protein [Daldinia caldariorum]|uniref:kinase domain-containing protein n=1 Tax=Daldinia caldariorum TaxID=326644 RepID=UPI0020083D40|nr:kinase domain-containing protein [Daldinia caldariorum]KAI1469059.1 kinase domain-containing protein [Daldinia caldariorum]